MARFESAFVHLSDRLFSLLSYPDLVENLVVQIGPTKTAPLLINPIEMRVLWMEIKYTKSAARLLNRVWVNKGGLDVSKEVLWDSVGQRVAVLQAVKVGGQKEILPIARVRTRIARAGLIGRIFFWPPTLTACKTAALWPTETHSTSLERSKPPLLTQSLYKSLASFLIHFFFSRYNRG